VITTASVGYGYKYFYSNKYLGLRTFTCMVTLTV